MTQPTPYPPTTTPATGYPPYGQGSGYGGTTPYPLTSGTSYPTPSLGGYPPQTAANYGSSSGYLGYPPATSTYTNPATATTTSTGRPTGGPLILVYQYFN